MATDTRMRPPAGPECGHSHCRQNYIDTGETDCVPIEGIGVYCWFGGSASGGWRDIAPSAHSREELEALAAGVRAVGYVVRVSRFDPTGSPTDAELRELEGAQR